jgi:23S rRNA (cytosine1962-C5)-methyltransferase
MARPERPGGRPPQSGPESRGRAPAKSAAGAGHKALLVSRATARFIEDGHPWVRPDRFTRGLGQFAAGDVATLVTEQGERIASAIVEPQGAVCARVFHRRADMAFEPVAALARAVARRAALFGDPETDCFRVVHGEGDHLPGLRVERYADVFVVVVFADAAMRAAKAVCAALLAADGPVAPFVRAPTVVLRDHRDDLRREEVRSARFGPGSALDPEGVVVGRELGVRYPLRPFDGLATGLYVDQRETRRWLRALAPGRRVLNLFAYTGAFSVSLLAAGAAHAVDVDLARPALARAEEAAALNGVADRHAVIKADCGAWLAGARDAFDLVIVDPPTAAMGGEGWVLRRDYPGVLAKAFARLAPGGLLVACCNTLNGKPYPLDEVVREAASAAGRAGVRPVEAPRLGEDVPQLKGFPEGRPYRLVAVSS